jgi:short-subunit dehydrogenase
LDQQVIVITGASSGIGLVTARMAARQGAAVAAAARNGEALEALAGEIRRQGGRALAVVCDVGREEDVRHLAEVAVREFGRIDTWVNNAGISIFGHVWDAVHGFTEVLRQEIEHQGESVSVSLIHPGRIDTPYNEHAGNYMPMLPVHRGMIYPPEAVAEAILWCAAHPKRDMFVGSQAKAAALIGRLAPRLTDFLMERIMYTSHQSRRRVSSGSRSRALFEPGYGGQERGTHEPHLLRKRSYYVAASKHPLATAAAVGLVLGAALLERSLTRSPGRRRWI